MNDLWTVLLLSLLPGVGNFVGAMAAEAWTTSPRLLNWALHAACGIVIAIVAVEVFPAARGSLAGWWIALAFACGGCAYLLLEAGVACLQRQGDSDGRSRMWMIYAAVAVDLIGDGVMIGSGSAVSASLALVLAAGQVLADVPEGFAAVATFRDKKVGRTARLAIAGSFFAYVVAAALGSYVLLRDASPSLKLAALVSVAGLLTIAAVEDILEEAHQAREDTRVSLLAFVGGFTLFTLVSAGLQTLVGR